MATPKFDGQRWRIQVQKDGKRFSFSSSLAGAKGRKECQAKYEAWLYDESGLYGSKTVRKVCEEYLQDLQARRGPRCEAYVQGERYIRLYIAPKIANRKINKITLREWQSLINEAIGAKGEPLSHKTLENLRGIIMAIIKFAYTDYQCELPRGTLYIPKGHSRSEKEILQPDQLKRLLQPSDLWYHSLFCFLAITGMRPGEALGLKVEDIKGDRAYIRRSVSAKGVITEGKNENARRMIPLGSLALGIIRKTIRRNEELNLRTDWIFCDIHGDHGKQTTARNHWLTLKEERDLSGSIYSLRHTFISMTKSVLPEQTIKDIVGHSVSMDTFGTYGHIVDGEARKAAEVIDLTFGEVFGEDLSASDGLSRT